MNGSSGGPPPLSTGGHAWVSFPLAMVGGLRIESFQVSAGRASEQLDHEDAPIERRIGEGFAGRLPNGEACDAYADEGPMVMVGWPLDRLKLAVPIPAFRGDIPVHDCFPLPMLIRLAKF
ncbi:hypothetical protein [Burkholderia glumae]